MSGSAGSSPGTPASLGLTGHARNLPNGSVEVVVDGPEDAMPELERLLRSGPASAQVERVERSTEPGDDPDNEGLRCHVAALTQLR